MAPLTYNQIADLVAQIQAELVSLGYPGSPPVTPVKVDMAFGAGSLSFTAWLWSVFLPRVNEILHQQGEFPAASDVGAQAIRELDAFPNAERLVDLLCEFDNLINRQP